MSGGNVKNGMVAGFAATAVLSILMVFKQFMGFAPSVNPIADWQQLLSVVSGSPVPLVAGWVPHFFLGTFVWGSVYAVLAPQIPGSAAVKGLIFGVLAWFLMMVVFFPVVGQGVFGLGFGLGPIPAGMTLLLHLVYGLVLGLVYASFGSGAADADRIPD